MNYGTFEEKRLLAGNVMVNDGAQLFIRGDAEDNQIQIIGNEDGSISISGRDGTTINGSNETLVISGTAVDPTAGKSIYDVSASYANGLRAHMGQGNDFIFVERVDFEGSSIIYGGAGDDVVGTYKASFGDRLVVQTFTGDDSISMEETTVSGDLYVRGLDGEDTIGITNTQFLANSFIAGGNDSDRMVLDTVDQIDSEGMMLVLSQNGDDLVSVDDVLNYGSLGIYGGAGNDDIIYEMSRQDARTDDLASDYNGESAEEIYVLGNIRIGGQGGDDGFSYSGFVTPKPAYQVGTFEREFAEENYNFETFVNEDLRDNESRLSTFGRWADRDGRFETLFDAVKATDWEHWYVTNEPSAYTVFAPTDAAFEKLPAGLLDSLSKEELIDVLAFHFAEGVTYSSDLVEQDAVDTILDDASISVEFNEDGDVILNGEVTLETTDVRTKNGVVHVINEVLLPSTP